MRKILRKTVLMSQQNLVAKNEIVIGVKPVVPVVHRVRWRAQEVRPEVLHGLPHVSPSRIADNKNYA